MYIYIYAFMCTLFFPMIPQAHPCAHTWVALQPLTYWPLLRTPLLLRDGAPSWAAQPPSHYNNRGLWFAVGSGNVSSAISDASDRIFRASHRQMSHGPNRKSRLFKANSTYPCIYIHIKLCIYTCIYIYM